MLRGRDRVETQDRFAAVVRIRREGSERQVATPPQGEAGTWLARALTFSQLTQEDAPFSQSVGQSINQSTNQASNQSMARSRPHLLPVTQEDAPLGVVERDRFGRIGPVRRE